MAFRNADAEKSLAYNDGIDYLVGANSVVFGQGDLLSQSTEFAIEATAGSTIIGVCLAEKTMASDNQTVARVKVGYTPLSTKNTYTLPIAGTSLVFAGDLVASNVVNLNVNGVAMTPITYNTSNNHTLDLIAAQLQTQFPSVIASATRSGIRTVVINTVGKMSSVVLTGILVTLGASQTTGVQTSLISTGDIGKFYGIVTATQFVDAATENASLGQLKLENYSSGDFGDFSIANT